MIEGFVSIADVAEADVSEIAAIEGFDEDVAAELQNRANVWLSARNEELQNRLDDLKVEDSLMKLEGLNYEMLVKLGENDVKTADDLGDLATDELIEIVGEKNMNRQDAEAMIMAIRETWFADEEPVNDTGEDSADKAAAEA